MKICVKRWVFALYKSLIMQFIYNMYNISIYIFIEIVSLSQYVERFCI